MLVTRVNEVIMSDRTTSSPTVHLYVPRNFDPSEHEELRGLEAASLWFVSHLVQRQWIFRRKKTEFVSVARRTIELYVPVRRVTELLMKLQQLGVVQSDGVWKRGQKALGWVLTEKYQVPVRRIPCPCDRLAQKIRANRKRSVKPLLPEHLFLWECLNKLRIDMRTTERLVTNLVPSAETKMPLDVWRSGLLATARTIHDRESWFSVDEFGRIHTAATQLHSSLRSCLFFPGRGTLAEIDVVASQVRFLLVVLLRAFPSLSRAVNRVSPECFPAFIAAPSPVLGSAIPASGTAVSSFWLENLEVGWGGVVPNDLVQFALDAASDDPYRQFSYQLAQRGGLGVQPSFADRNAVKKELFRTALFNNPQQSYVQQSVFMRAFAVAYPTVARFLERSKLELGYASVAHRMQAAESGWLIAVTRRLMNLDPRPRLVTVHDSILLPIEFNLACTTAMWSEFEQLGIRPTLKVNGECIRPRPLAA